MKIALVNRYMFDYLSEYSCSIPGGVYAGKLWKMNIPYAAPKWQRKWYLREYFIDPIPSEQRIYIRTWTLYIVDNFVPNVIVQRRRSDLYNMEFFDKDVERNYTF